MSHYNNDNYMDWLGPSLDFGAGAEIYGIQIPRGKSAILVDYGVQGCTEAFVGSSAAATIAVGTSSNPDAYGEEFGLNGCADKEGRTVRGTYDEPDDVDDYIVDANIPATAAAGTIVVVTCTQATGSPAGIAQPYVRLLISD